MSMTLIRWEPARELQTIQSEVNRLFDTFFDLPSSSERNEARRWLPAMDLLEDGDDYVLRADLPGLSAEDVRVSLDQNLLTISGQRRSEHEQRGEGVHRLERAYGSFTRTLTLPDGVAAEQIRASLKDGVLEVRVPKPAERRPQEIEIKVDEQARTIDGRAQEEGAAEISAQRADSEEQATQQATDAAVPA
jgi:HSP20 family protein